jgi:tRNA U34 5-methylaminomethyl-2-thiouridine-forming methyltransferase MnmC
VAKVVGMQTDQIIETQDGSHSILSYKYGVSYHSKYGAITESRHVFIQAGLYPQLVSSSKVDILEIGLGTGLNAFLSFLEAEKKDLQLYYEGIEAYPLSAAQYNALNYPELLKLPEHKSHFIQLHESPWGEDIPMSEHFTFRKTRQFIEEMDKTEAFDVIYFDAFAPSAQPELWEEKVLAKMYKALRPQGILVTYCAKGVVKRRLKGLGFTVESLPGPPGKREMTRAVK